MVARKFFEILLIHVQLEFPFKALNKKWRIRDNFYVRVGIRRISKTVLVISGKVSEHDLTWTG